MTRVRAPLRLRSINLVSVLQLTQKSSLPSLRQIGVSLCVSACLQLLFASFTDRATTTFALVLTCSYLQSLLSARRSRQPRSVNLGKL